MDQKEVASETPNEQMPETEYTSEIFKLEVKNLPTNFGFGVDLLFRLQNK